ncbi:MAG TPA: hypothetical protein VNK44_07590 [Candidatus Nitrosotenuis sp.]|nr:hypothetical protein [Candidatus Nitrosotenuis sp.]
MHDEDDANGCFSSSNCNIQAQKAVQMHCLWTYELVARQKAVI